MHTLTPDQQKAADDFFAFLMSDAKTFVLSGGAGVGKTFLMSHICNTVMQEYTDTCKMLGENQIYTEVAFAATTNKAAEVLEKSLGLPTQTIQSYLALKVKENFKTGKTSLEKTASWKVRTNQIVFIDESSMIDANLYDVIMESFENSKIVFVGDHAQMAPVDDSVSPVYTNVDEDHFVFLAQPVRNANSPALVNLCSQLRDTVETGVFRPIQNIPGSVEYLDGPQMQSKLQDIFATDLNPSCRILAYTNDRVKEFNAYIREIRGLPEKVSVGDVLVSASTYQVGKSTLNVEREVTVSHIYEDVRDHGYGEIFEDGKPILTRYMDVILRHGGIMAVNIAEEPERLKVAIKHFASKKNWSTYFDLKGLCADLRDKAACTVYKSQGSTYESVFIDLGNIGSSFSPDQVARMVFVAASRATTKVYLFGRLPARYHNTSEKVA